MDKHLSNHPSNPLRKLVGDVVKGLLVTDDKKRLTATQVLGRLAKPLVNLEEVFNTGLNHLVGKNGAQRDARKAVHYFLQAAQHGYPPAQSRLFECFRAKIGIADDEKVDTEASSSPVTLGLCLLFGRGVPQDHKEAARLFAAAAEQGDLMGQFAFGRCHNLGQGVPQDYKKAVEWYTKAAEAGYANSQKNLKILKDQGH